jgi:hypothetical protein
MPPESPSDPSVSATAPGVVPTPAEFKYQAGPGVPEWAVGKSPQEILGLAVKQNEIISAVPAYQPPQEKPWQQYPQQQAPQMGQPTDDEWVATPQKAFEKAFGSALEANVTARFAPMLDGMAQSVAQSARAQAAMVFSKEFGKFGPEIDNEVAKVPVAQRTPDLYRYAVDIVRGRHVDELAEERMRERMAALPMAERSMGGAAGVTPSGLLDWNTLPPNVKDKWQRAGITEATIREDCAKWGMSPEDFLKMTLNNQVISETPDGGWTVGRDALKIPGGYR